MPHNHCCETSSVRQTLDELDFERGIWFAAQHNDLLRVKELINKKTDVNAEDKAGYTALHYASRNGHFEMCNLLISAGANVDVVTKCGKASALHRCASAGHLDVFKLLLKSGALMGRKDADGKTELHRAVEGGHLSIVKEILNIQPQLGLEVDIKGNQPRHYANSAICQVLDELVEY